MECSLPWALLSHHTHHPALLSPARTYAQARPRILNIHTNRYTSYNTQYVTLYPFRSIDL